MTTTRDDDPPSWPTGRVGSTPDEPRATGYREPATPGSTDGGATITQLLLGHQDARTSERTHPGSGTIGLDTADRASSVTAEGVQTAGRTISMSIKERFAEAARQATQRLSTHRDTVDRGIDKVGTLADNKTGGKYGQQIRRGKDQLRTGLDKIGQRPVERPENQPGSDPTGPTGLETRRTDDDQDPGAAMAPAR